MVADMNTGTSASPTIKQVTVHGRTVTIIDATGNGTNTETYGNFPSPAPVETLRRLLRQLKNLAPLPRRHIPWTSPQHWVHKLVHPDFPYCRGKLAAVARVLQWLVKSKPARAEPRR